MTALHRIQPIRATIRHPRGTTHAARLTHADENGENFRAEYTAGIFKGATEIISAEQITATHD